MRAFFDVEGRLVPLVAGCSGSVRAVDGVWEVVVTLPSGEERPLLKRYGDELEARRVMCRILR